MCGCVHGQDGIRKHFADAVVVADANAIFDVFAVADADHASWERQVSLPQRSYFEQQQYYKIPVAFAVFCSCHIVKGWLWVPVYFKHYHSC